jgi:hypothetical protein
MNGRIFINLHGAAFAQIEIKARTGSNDISRVHKEELIRFQLFFLKNCSLGA